MRAFRLLLAAAMICFAGFVLAHEGDAKSRDFILSYSATAKGLQPGQMVRLWLPVPANSAEQSATLAERRAPANARTREGKEAKHGNSMLYAEGPAGVDGTFTVSASFRVKRQEVVRDLAAKEELDKFLKADAKVPVGGKALTLIEGKELPQGDEEKGRALYDVVFGHMKYSKEGKGWGQGDSDWACDSKFGNCTDFHSLFISLARAQKLPAKFEIGFSIPEKRGEGDIAGYHCWAYFLPKGKGWVPVDISEASKNPSMKDYYFGHLTADRVTLTTGRDLILDPPQQGPPLNFFIYPYAETNGKPLPAEQVTRKVTYKDMP